MEEEPLKIFAAFPSDVFAPLAFCIGMSLPVYKGCERTAQDRNCKMVKTVSQFHQPPYFTSLLVHIHIHTALLFWLTEKRNVTILHTRQTPGLEVTGVHYCVVFLSRCSYLFLDLSPALRAAFAISSHKLWCFCCHLSRIFLKKIFFKCLVLWGHVA